MVGKEKERERERARDKTDREGKEARDSGRGDKEERKM